MNVLVYTDDFLARSMTFIYNQVLEVRKECRVRVACLQRLNAELFPLSDVFVVPHDTRKTFTNRVLRKLNLCFALRDGLFERDVKAYLRDEQIDLLHAHFGPSALRVYDAAKSLEIPLLITFHGFDASSLLRNPAYVRCLKRVMDDPMVHGIASSAALKKRIASCGINVSRTIAHHPGIDTAFFDPRNANGEKRAGTFTFLQVSNFVEKKGHELTVRSFARFPQSCPNMPEREARLILAGDGPLRQRMERLAGRLQLAERVTFTGAVDRFEVRDLLACADVFVHPSVTGAGGDQEGLPSVLLEAMAMGLPVLSTRHSGIPEAIREGVDGILVDEGDISGCARAMRLAWEGKTEWHNPEAARRRVVENFDLSTQSKHLMEVYARVVQSSACYARV